MKRFIYIVSLCLCLFLTACNDMTYLSTIVIKNNSRYTYYYKISCSETYYQDGGTLQSGSTLLKPKYNPDILMQLKPLNPFRCSYTHPIPYMPNRTKHIQSQ